MLDKIFLGLCVGLIVTGCNSLPTEKSPQSFEAKKTVKPRVPDDLKEFATDALNYGDYYMKEFVDYAKNNNEEASQNSIKIGAELIRGESDKSIRVSERLLPKLDKETERIAKQCNKSIFGYSANYLLLHIGIFNNSLSFSESESIEPRWKEVIKSRGEMIKDCQLDS